MLNKLSLAKKLTLGFGLVLSLLVLVGLIAFTGLDKAKSGFTEYREIARDATLSGKIEVNMLLTQMMAKDFMTSGGEGALERFQFYFDKTEGFIEEAQKEISASERAKSIDNIDQSFKEFKSLFVQIVTLKEERNRLLIDVLTPQEETIQVRLASYTQTADFDGDSTSVTIALGAAKILLSARLSVFKFLNSNDISMSEVVTQQFEEVEKILHVLNHEMQADEQRQLLTEALGGVDLYQEGFAKLVQAIDDCNQHTLVLFDQIGPEVAANIENLNLDIKRVQDILGPELQAANSQSTLLIIILSIAAIVLGIGVAVLIVRGILRQMGGDPADVATIAVRVAEGDLSISLPDRGEVNTSLYAAIRNMVDKLKEKAEMAQHIADGDLTTSVSLASEQDQLGISLQQMSTNLNKVLGQVQIAGEQIASGSHEVSDTSQSLSQGATQSASSLEEISASLNQLASQTSTNSENANLANSLASEASEAAQSGTQKMQSMVKAMAEINDSSQNISKIIKTIDEIAFQTNLLALNAAVEAARAGQHGKGFAVVAEEVRNLAARSSKAAEETSVLIEGSVAKTANGSEIANQTADALSGIVSSIGKVTDLVAEIASASSEQANGVNQISEGVNQIDAVTQQNTASAEESAAAAEELSGQAEQLNEMLKQFTLDSQHSTSDSKVSPAQLKVAHNSSWGMV